jgi:sugar phosphate isomerase/epimerase
MNKYEPAVVVSNYNKECNVYETIDAICDAGFKNVFIEWYNRDWEIPQEEQLKYVNEKGLNIIFAHLGYQNINDMWIEEETGIVDRYKNDIRICHENNIPMVVMHLTSKTEAPIYGEMGLKRIREICDYAKSLNVVVAFENTKIKGYLDYVIDNIKNDNVGICFDSGHYHAHFNDELDFNKFKNRIFAIHLHDNDQSDDLHLLPFDGTLNWEDTIRKLKESNYEGPVTLEIHHHRDYVNMPVKDFYKKGYEIALKIKDMFEKE